MRKRNATTSKPFRSDQKVLPAEHPSTIITLRSYAYLLRQMGRENEARALEARFKTK